MKCGEVNASLATRNQFDRGPDLKTEQEIKEWLENGGLELLFEAAEKAAADAEKFREAMRVDPDTLDKPMTI